MCSEVSRLLNVQLETLGPVYHLQLVVEVWYSTDRLCPIPSIPRRSYRSALSHQVLVMYTAVQDLGNRLRSRTPFCDMRVVDEGGRCLVTVLLLKYLCSLHAAAVREYLRKGSTLLQMPIDLDISNKDHTADSSIACKRVWLLVTIPGSHGPLSDRENQRKRKRINKEENR